MSPGGSGYVTCIQNMKIITIKFKSGGLHEKHVVATWNLGLLKYTRTCTVRKFITVFIYNLCMRINIISTGRYYTTLDITECGAASVMSKIVQYLPIRTCIVHNWCAQLTTLPPSCAYYLEMCDS